MSRPTHDPLKSTTQDVRGVHVLSLSGDIDLAVKGELTSLLTTTVERARLPLIVDLTGVRYIDSSGFAALVQTKKKLTARHDQLYIVANAPNIRRLFSILMIDKLFTMCTSLDDAVAAASNIEVTWKSSRSSSATA